MKLPRIGDRALVASTLQPDPSQPPLDNVALRMVEKYEARQALRATLGGLALMAFVALLAVGLVGLLR